MSIVAPQTSPVRSSIRAISLHDALARLTDRLEPVPEATIPIEEAIGSTLARPLVVPRDVPEHSVAMRPGWAVASAWTIGASAYSPITLTSRPARVTLGDALPRGTDAVLPEDAVSFARGSVEIGEAATPGDWARRAGEDIRAGSVLCDTGVVASGLTVEIARAAGIEGCWIRRPSLLLVGAGEGRVRSPALSLIGRFAQASGADVREGSAAEGRLRSDLVVASAHGLPELPASAPVVAERLALRPGEDASLILAGTTPVVLCPDTIADGLALWLTVIAPVLDRLRGAAPGPAIGGQITRKISSRIGLSEIALVLSTRNGFEPIAVGDLPLSHIGRASHWLLVPPESEGFRPGATVSVGRLPTS